jgi:GLPGLI family protein
MNSKIIFCLFFFLLNFNIFSQSQDIKAQYKVYPTYGTIENDEKIKSKKIPDLFKGVDIALETLEYQLNISKNKSHFFLKDILHADKKVAGLAISFAGRESVFIDKNNKSFVKVKYILSEKHLVSFSPQQNWTLTTEEKTIQGFKCYKATVLRTIRMSKDKVKTYIAEAWYCPELPFSFGPKDFCELPGLILQLQDDKVTFVASKIELNTKPLQDIELKDNQKIISEDEFYNIVDLKAKQYFEEKYSKN